MTTNSKPRKATNVPKIPTSWLILLVFLGILYSLFQPWANSRLGLKLPSIPELISADRSQPTQRPKQETQRPKQETEGPKQETERPKQESEGPKQQAEKNETRPIESSDHESTSKNNTEASPYDFLKNDGSEVYISKAGLRYTRGSEEGHRIKHLARHLEDIPNRSGSHGVFEGGWQVTLQRIDDAYRRSKQNDAKTKVRKEENRSIIETEFSDPIGYVGGRDGAKKGNPTTRRLRLVTEGDRFITAFPY
jgi:hypothetical protein